MSWKTALLATAFVLAGASGTAKADVDEVRVGVAYHDLHEVHGHLASPKEDGPDVDLSAVFTSPGWLHFLGSPRPYLELSANTQGNTSLLSTGLYWRYRYSHSWALEIGGGVAVHNGELDIPRDIPRDTPASDAFDAQHELLGSRWQFQESAAFEHINGPHTAWQIYGTHLSNGQIFHRGRNQGLNEVGLRFIYRFRESAAE